MERAKDYFADEQWAARSPNSTPWPTIPRKTIATRRSSGWRRASIKRGRLVGDPDHRALDDGADEPLGPPRALAPGPDRAAAASRRVLWAFVAPPPPPHLRPRRRSWPPSDAPPRIATPPRLRAHPPRRPAAVAPPRPAPRGARACAAPPAPPTPTVRQGPCRRPAGAAGADRAGRRILAAADAFPPDMTLRIEALTGCSRRTAIR